MTYAQTLLDAFNSVENDLRDANDRYIFWSKAKEHLDIVVSNIKKSGNIDKFPIQNLGDLSRANSLCIEQLEIASRLTPMCLLFDNSTKDELDAAIRQMNKDLGDDTLCQTIH